MAKHPVMQSAATQLLADVKGDKIAIPAPATKNRRGIYGFRA